MKCQYCGRELESKGSVLYCPKGLATGKWPCPKSPSWANDDPAVSSERRRPVAESQIAQCPACRHRTSDKTPSGLWVCSNSNCDVHTFFPGTLTSVQKLRATAERDAIQEAA